MKTNELSINFRKIGVFVPIIIYFILSVILSLGESMGIRNFPLNHISSISTELPIFSLLALVGTYLSCHLYTQKKTWGYGGIIFLSTFLILYYYVVSGNWGLTIWALCTNLRSAVMGFLIYMSYDWYRKSQRQKELERRNLQSELKLLKNQLNPHFLFNTLNNIDSLIHSNPERASKSLVQMSEMMRYMIYETNIPEVDLNQELDYINNYLDLQQLQYDNPELVSYTLEGTSDGVRIAPMLFISFIENAFKHCTDKKAPNAIRLFLQIQKSEIHFEVSNLFDPTKHINKDSSSGIGLSIVKRRLDFLYPNRYSLQINQKNGYFDVSLTIKLL